jgi:hypothetical protein
VAGAQIRQLITGTGDTYTCQNITAGVGTWAVSNGSGSGTVSNQVEGQIPTSTGSATALNFSSPFEVLVSAYCGSTTSCNPGGGITDESKAIRAIATAYGCSTANGNSCNIIDDMTGTGYWSEVPLPSSFTGHLTFVTNGAAHQILLDGMSTDALPTDTHMYGMGTTSSDQIAENTTIAMCNPLTDNCVNGGFQIQNTSATTIGLSVSGSLMTVTLAAGAPFTTTSTALNQLVADRWVCIGGATGASKDNGCFTVASVTSATAPQVFVLNVDSTTQTTCASPCTAAVAYLGTPAISIGTGGGGGVFGTRIGDIIVDCHGMIGGIGWVNGQGEEGTGTDGHVEVYNCPTAGFNIEQSGIYGGNGTIGATNSGTYANLAVNFNPWIVTLPGGANCSNTGVGDCIGGVVAAGSAISFGAGTTGFGVLTPSPAVNPNWVGAQITGNNSPQSQSEIQHLTVSCQDKTSTANCVFGSSGASQPTGIVVIGDSISFGQSHTEFVENAADICGDPAINATLYEAYGSNPTQGVTFNTGSWSWNTGGLGLDIGTSGNGANCHDILLLGVNLGGKSGTILEDNITGNTITGSSTEQGETYILGHGTPPSVFSTSPTVSNIFPSLTVGTTSNASTPAGDVNVTTGFQIGGAAASSNYLCGNGTNFVACLAGVIPNAQTGTTYTYSATTDRAAYTSFSNAGAIAVTLPSAASLANNWVNVSCDIGAGTATITPTTSTISYTNGSTYTSAAATLPLTTGQCAWIYSNNTNYFAILRTGGTSLPESGLTGATTATTITESGATSSVTRAGVATANLTAPWVFQNTNSTNNNTSIGLGVTTPGTSTGQTTLNINGASTGGDLLDAGTGGTWTAGVLSGQTILAKLGINGGWTGLNFTSNGTTAGFFDFPQGTTSSAVPPCNTANSICFQAPTSVTLQLRVLAGAPATGFSLWTNSSGTMTETISATSGTLTSGVGTWGNSAINTVLASTVANVAGHFTNLQVVTALFGTCTTAPIFNVFDGTTNTGSTVTAAGSTQTKGTGTSTAQTLTFAAGDIIGIYISSAGGTCTADQYTVTAQYSIP